jgi:hypothetical protein
MRSWYQVVTLVVVSACGVFPAAPPPQAPPPPATLQTLPQSKDPPSVSVTSDPNVAPFRKTFERTLGRAGFRVLQAADRGKNALAISLIGDGSGTAGSIGGASFAKQVNKLDATVSKDGRLLQELHANVQYTVVQEGEAFDAFNTRVAAAATQGYEDMAIDLTNQLVANLPR